MTNGAAVLFMRTAYQNTAIYFGDTPLAYGLDYSGRWAEAYDFCLHALEADPSNGNAAGNLSPAPDEPHPVRSRADRPHRRGLRQVRADGAISARRHNRSGYIPRTASWIPATTSSVLAMAAVWRRSRGDQFDPKHHRPG